MGQTSDQAHFVTLRRQQFRTYFQPSRVVLGIFPTADTPVVNVITLCFDMYCSYKPPMMAFAIHKNAYSYSLLQDSSECVLAVPGETLAEQSLFCGLESGRDMDKFQECRFRAIASTSVEVPGIEQAIANIEMKITQKVSTGDHMLATGHVLRFGVDEKKQERCLLSVGPRNKGYEVLARRGIHRIGVVAE